MNNQQLKSIRTYKLGFSELEMAFHLNMSVLDYKEIEKGEYKLSQIETDTVKTLAEKYTIPRINDHYVFDMLKDSSIDLKGKAQLIAKFDLNVASMQTDGNIDRVSLMPEIVILKHLEARVIGDIDG
jgi:hypothetical protein